MKFIIGFILLFPTLAFAGRDCYAPWGGTVHDGFSVMAYRESRPTNGNRCQYEYRTCRNGWLSGSYRYQSCTEDYGCNTEFGYMRHLESITAYLHSDEYGGQKCQSEIRRCSYGRLSGSYHYRYCTEHP